MIIYQKKKNRSIVMESCNVLGKENEIKKEFNYLLKKYQDNQKEFLKDYDETIYNLIIWFIANFNVSGIIRSEITDSIKILISIREIISQNYSDKCSCDD